MAWTPQLLFEKTTAQAQLLSPLQSFAPVTSCTEYRFDPLTGRMAIIGLNLAGKRTVLYSETDEALLAQLAHDTRPNCFFCPERVAQVTPRYPEDVLPGGGRLARGQSLLFPNLFPLTEVHAIVALGAQHFLHLDEFTPDLLLEGLSLAVEFVNAVGGRDEAPPYWSLCANYLPPGGASIVHPHLQVLGSSKPLTVPGVELGQALRYWKAEGRCFFDDLVASEEELQERFIHRWGPVTWVAAFAPRGNMELQGICTDVAGLEELTPEHLHGLAQGLSLGLRLYRDQGYSTFNACLYAAPSGPDRRSFRVYASLVARQSVVKNYRCDDYFLQKMLGTEILVDSPEDVAAHARSMLTSP